MTAAANNHSILSWIVLIRPYISTGAMLKMRTSLFDCYFVTTPLNPIEKTPGDGPCYTKLPGEDYLHCSSRLFYQIHV